MIFFLSSLPDVPGTSFLDQVLAGDKVGHLVLYGILGATLARPRWLQGVPFGALVLIGALYGASDEWHQSFVPGRQVSALDWIADLFGVAVGLWLAHSFFAPSYPRTITQVTQVTQVTSLTPPPRPGAS